MGWGLHEPRDLHPHSLRGPVALTDPSDRRLSAPAAQRNRGPICEVLRRFVTERANALEIASGTGEHAAWLADQLPGICLQPSDPDPTHRASIDAWRRTLGRTPMRAALALDTTRPGWERDPGIPSPIHVVICINMIHIAPWEAALGLLRGAGDLLGPGGVLYLYGPYRRAGHVTAPSNEAFDRSLRARDPAWGIRDLEAVTEAAASHGLDLEEIVEMPAHNLSVVLRRGVR